MKELLKQTQAYLDYIKEHYDCVQKAWALIKEKCPDLWFVEDEAFRRLLDDMVLRHDESKLSGVEFVPYRCKFFPVESEKNRIVQHLTEVHFSDAWEHHKASNLHHCQSWTAILNPQARELECHCVHTVVDWVGMALQRGNPLAQYYRNNKDKILIPEWAHALVEVIFTRLEGIATVSDCSETVACKVPPAPATFVSCEVVCPRCGAGTFVGDDGVRFCANIGGWEEGDDCSWRADQEGGELALLAPR